MEEVAVEMAERALVRGVAGGITRRQFARWAASASALLWAPAAMAAPKDVAMFLRAGDPYSDPKMLRKRYDRGGVDIAEDSMIGRALVWRLLGDPFAAGFSLGALLGSVAYRSTNWVDVAQYAITADWLSTYPKFTPAMKTYAGDQLLKAAGYLVAETAFDHPSLVSYSNVIVNRLTACLFATLQGVRLSPANPVIGELRNMVERSFRNVMEQMQFVTPDGSNHESMDFMRSTYAPLAMVSELRRTLLGEDTAEQISLFANMGPTYLYKTLPDGTFSREGDCQNAAFNGYDSMVLGYAVHRFQDRYAAWILRHTDPMPKWELPVMQFLWDNPSVLDADPFTASPKDLKLAKHFRGVDQVVFRNGFGAKNTRIEFDCGPYFARHQHLDRNHFTIHHRGSLAIDSGAAYAHSDSPHSLNYYRRTVAHNTMLVYDPAEKFFWGDHQADAANDGGQRMNSPLYWDTIRGVANWHAVGDVWEVGKLRTVEIADPRYMYAMGDATKAYSPAKLEKFTRELLYFPSHDVLFVYDDVRSTNPALRKTWLLHTVDEPEVFSVEVARPTATSGARPVAAPSAAGSPIVRTVRVVDRDGEMTMHSILPERASVTKRGGPGQEFWTPGDASGGDWGSGRNWPLDPAAGGPLPASAEEAALWKTFYGDELKTLDKSNREHAEPGAWRLEVTPLEAAKDDVFLHAFEIGDKEKTGKTPAVRVHGPGVEGALCGRMVALFVKAEHGQKSLQFKLPNETIDAIWMRGLPANLEIALDYYDGTVPLGRMGAPLRTETTRVSPRGTVMVAGAIPAGARVSLRAGAL